jgi:hypothetical protein
MIVLYPAVLIAAFVVMRRAREARSAGEGATWFGWWTVAGALFTFSFLTGFSIGLFILPLAAASVIWAARSAPGAEAIGFLAGAGLVLLIPWRLEGVALCSIAVASYAALRLRTL